MYTGNIERIALQQVLHLQLRRAKTLFFTFAGSVNGRLARLLSSLSHSQYPSNSSSMSQRSSAASSNSTAGSAKSSASSAAGSTKSAASGTSSSKSSSEAPDTTENSISELGQAPGDHSVSAISNYDTSVAQAVSAYAQSARNLDQYSRVGPMNKDADKSFASQIKQLQSGSKMAATDSGKTTGRKVFVMRHGERMDRLFPEWLTVAITDEGKYRPYDMNQPLTMIERIGGVGWAGYEHDSPVTEMGSLSGQMVGRGLKNCKVDVKQVVSSPALRCVQTANAILKEIQNPDLKICVEPGLFEWLAWYDKMPQWFDVQTLLQTSKYKMNELYKPIMSVADLVGKKNESTKDYCERVANVTKKVLEQFKGPGTLLFVGHGSTLDVGGRCLLGKPMVELNRGEMDQMGVYYPYCSIVAVEELQENKWRVIPSALPQLTFLGFSNRFTPDYFNRP